MGNSETMAALRGAVRRREAGVTMTSSTYKILEVAGSLRQPFTRGELVVACWKKYPGDFRLRGLAFAEGGTILDVENYPDANRVWSLVCGKRGLLGKDLIHRCGDGLYTTGGPPGDRPNLH